MSRRSVQDPGYQAEYEAFCQNREQAQLPMCRTVTFCDSGGGRPEHMVRTFLQTRDTQREPPDKGKGKEGKVRVELLPHRLLHPQERGKRAMEMEELLPLPLRQRVEILPLLVYQFLLVRSGLKLLGPRYKRWDIRLFHTKTLSVLVAFRI